MAGGRGGRGGGVRGGGGGEMTYCSAERKRSKQTYVCIRSVSGDVRSSGSDN